MISRDTLDGLVVILIAMAIFKASSYLPTIEGLFQKYSMIIIVLSFVVFFNRKKILSYVAGNKNGRNV